MWFRPGNQLIKKTLNGLNSLECLSLMKLIYRRVLAYSKWLN
uniref:Uncharacterized protein n=1 Tax=Myoviridae sp. ctCo31 TaxID=2825053 RepID=A0A8S5UMF5_9CAUD|nr:MAG TPA: hypothetical protein [Myoviridae sp. ctCo31]